MQSLFSRVRTQSTKNAIPQHSNTLPPQAGPSSTYDEFGRERSSSLWPTSNGADPRFSSPRPERGIASFPAAVRQRTLSAPGAAKDLPLRPNSPPIQVPQMRDVFHPFHLPSSRNENPSEREYGYLGAANEAVLSLDQVEKLVDVVGEEILSRAVTTPLLFSTQALDVSSNRVRSLVRSFLSYCQSPGNLTTEARWHQDARLAGPHELGMLLRWGLARVMRVVNGQYSRGLLDWDTYVKWKLDEEENHFPPTQFPVFLSMIPTSITALFQSLFNIFSRLCAYSSQSGLTPIVLSNLFGPLLFGLGPESSPFSQTYAAYLRSSHATEHLILSYIRNVEVESRTTASTMPSRLKDWIRGYPIMIPPLKDLAKPRRGCKLIKVASVRRNVRLYSHDLVKTAASWGTEGDIGGRHEWQRITSKTMPPKYTDDYRKRLDIPIGYAPSIASSDSKSSMDMSTLPSSIASLDPSGRTVPRSIAFGFSLEDFGNVVDTDLNSASKPFRSLTDFQWGKFEEIGFSEPDKKMLQFDLNESARSNRGQKRQTMSWNDFSSMGFLREDEPLSDTLQFSTPIASSINTWPSHADEIHRKLKKTQKVLPSFGWETTPVTGQEWTIEEGFVSCWADLLLSSGWMNRSEGTFREANWAMVEFKALPVNPNDSEPLSPGVDPRTSSQWFLFEEFVPQEYREELLRPPKKGTKALFASPKNKDKKWKPAATLNGKPYNGRPRSPSSREAEFDAMLRAPTSETRIVSLSGESRSQTLPNQRGIPTSNNYAVSSQYGERGGGSAPRPPPKDKPSPLSIFKRPGSSKRNPSKIASEYDPNIDFETKTASDSSGGESPVAGYTPFGHARRQSKDDAWVDILVAGSRRMAGQDAILPSASNGNGSIKAFGGQELYPDYFPPNGSEHMRTPKTSLTRPRSNPELPREDSSRFGPEYLQEESMRDSYGVSQYGVSEGNRHTYREDISYADSDEEEEVMEVPRASVIEPLGGPEIRVRTASDADERRPQFDNRPHHQQVLHHQYVGQDVDDEGDFEAATMSPTSSARVLSDDGSYARDSYQPRSASPSSTMSPVRAISPTSQPIDAPKPLVPRKPGAIGSLIEMYAKKDEEAAKSHYEPKASRLPVRTSSQPTIQEERTSPGGSPEPPLPVEDPVDRFILSPSPARYVHGAPLHNVMEEDSEE